MENRIIDFRLRPPFGDFLKGDMYNGYALEYNAHWGHEPAKTLVEKTMESMIADMDAGGVRYGVAAARTWAGVSNESVCELVEKYPDRFIGLAAINGENPFVKGVDDAIAVVDKFILSGPCKGLCLEPGFVPDVKYSWRPDDERIYPLYEYCQKNHVLVDYTWGSIGAKNFIDLYKPEYIDHVAAAFPDLVIVLNHAGWPYIIEHLGIAIARENVYLGLDAVMMPNMPGYDIYAAAVNRSLKEKVIWGSCFPIGPGLKGNVQVMRDIGISEDAFPYLMWRNAEKVLGL